MSAAGSSWRFCAIIFGLAVATFPFAIATSQTLPWNGSTQVVVDFLAADRDGRPILDLDAKDLSLRVDGRTRAIHSLQLVDAGISSGEDVLAAAKSALPAPYGTNRVQPGHFIGILVDEESIRPGREARTVQAIEDLLTVLGPKTRVALATPLNGWITSLTVNRDTVRQSLARIAGRASLQDDQECRTRVTLRRTRALLEPFSGGAAPTIIVVSGGLVGPRQEIPVGSRSLARGTTGVAPRLCDIRPEDFLEIRDAASSARAHMYVVKLEDVLPNGNMGQTSVAAADLDEGLRNLASMTGGRLIHLTNDARNPLTLAAGETASYYLLTFDATSSEQNGASHRVEVQTSRSGVAVTMRQQVFMPRGTPVRTEIMTPSALLREPALHRDIPLRVTGYVARHGDPKLTHVIAVAESLDAPGSITAATAGLFSPSGRLITEWTSSGTLPKDGRLVMAMAAPIGTYRLRVAAVDARGHGGTADYFVDAELMPAGLLRLGALVLGTGHTDSFRPAFEFRAEPVAVASLEIYGLKPDGLVMATLEVAETLNGRAIQTIPLAIAATQERDRVVASADIPLGALPSGDFVVRATVREAGQAEGRVFRTLRKVP